MNIELSELKEILGNSLDEFPQSHTEGLNANDFSGESLENVAEKVGGNYYEQTIENSPGLKGAFEEVSETGTKEEFAEAYKDFVADSEKMKEENPDMYEFFKDRVFGGKEFEGGDISFCGSGSDSKKVADVGDKLEAAKRELDRRQDSFVTAVKNDYNVTEKKIDLKTQSDRVESLQKEFDRLKR